MSLVILIVFFLILIIIGWFCSCYFIFYAWFEIGLNDGDDINLNSASKNLWYASITSWITLSIIFILIILGIILGIILCIFAFPLVMAAFDFVCDIFLCIVGSFFSKGKKIPILYKIIIWAFFLVAVIFTCITGYYALISAHYINKGSYTSSVSEIKKSLEYCYYTAGISIAVLLFIGIIIFAEIYLFYVSKKEKARKENSE